MIKEKTARKIASNWHSGQWSQLYAFASSGRVETENTLLCIEEICQEIIRPEIALKPFHRSKKDQKELQMLLEYLLFDFKINYGVHIEIGKDYYGLIMPILYGTNHNVRGISRLQ